MDFDNQELWIADRQRPRLVRARASGGQSLGTSPLATIAFGVTHDERISYLTDSDAQDLATIPIMLDGASRYRGKSLEKLLYLTAGNPFYLQIMCDHLVRHLISRRGGPIVEADIDRASQGLKHRCILDHGSVCSSGHDVAQVPFLPRQTWKVAWREQGRQPNVDQTARVDVAPDGDDHMDGCNCHSKEPEMNFIKS